jgi:hypothetical protein
LLNLLGDLILKEEKCGIKTIIGQIRGRSSGQERFGVQEIQQINLTPNSNFGGNKGETMDSRGGQG